MSLVTVLMVILGLVLIYAAVKGRDPRDILKEAIGGK